jgi:hypothetical protein
VQCGDDEIHFEDKAGTEVLAVDMARYNIKTYRENGNYIYWNVSSFLRTWHE